MTNSKHAWLIVFGVVGFLVGCAKADVQPAADDAPREPAAAETQPAEETPPAGANAEDGAPTAAAAPAELRQAELGTTNNVHAVGDIYLAGQPGEDDLELLAERGVKTVVCLRKPEEITFDEAAAVEAAGMEFVSIPFDGAEELTDDVFDRVREALAEHGDEPLVLHCGRANRVGAVWMVHRVLNDGVGIDQALEEAEVAGLRTPEYAEKAQDYIRRKQADAAPAANAEDDADR
jgi:uncharacterized protein (TIGR01244 family)